MDLRQLAALVAVADHHTFSAAARALHTVQSNVSTHVARLERELGVTLVDRPSGGLTPEGQAVVDRARRIHGELEALLADVTSVRNQVAGTARVGLIGTTARWFTAPLLDAMAADYPGIGVVVVDATTTSLLPQLSTGQLDLALVALPVRDPDVEAEPLFDEDLVVLAPAAHPLAERSSVTLDELARYDLLLGAPGTAFRDDLDTQAAAAGLQLRHVAEIDGLRLLATLAMEGFGPAVVPASAAPRDAADGSWRRVDIAGTTGRSVGLARWRRGLPSAPARALRDVLLRVLRDEAVKQPGLRLVDAPSTRG